MVRNCAEFGSMECGQNLGIYVTRNFLMYSRPIAKAAQVGWKREARNKYRYLIGNLLDGCNLQDYVNRRYYKLDIRFVYERTEVGGTNLIRIVSK
jgi:hypothetical protein